MPRPYKVVLWLSTELHPLCGENARRNLPPVFRPNFVLHLVEIPAVTPSETQAIVTLSLLAAFVDGEKHERERAEIKRIA